MSDGQINMSPDSTSKKAAQDALNGGTLVMVQYTILIQIPLQINGFGLGQWQ